MARSIRYLLLALTLLATACGGDDDGVELAPSTTQAATTTAAATTEAPTTTAAATTTGPPETSAPAPTNFVILSSAFDEGDPISIEFSCDGANLSPELLWSGVPAGTTSLALLMNDPDAAGWVHWIAWNIPPDSTGFAQDVPAGDLADGTRQGANDFNQAFAAGDVFPGGATVKVDGYDGPCPGPAPHRYVFTLFALSGTIDLPTGTPAADIEAAIADATLNGSMLDQTALTGEYAAP